MFYEVASRRVVIDKKGNDKSVTENFVVSNAALFSEAETAVYLKFSMENDVVAVRRSSITDVINEADCGEDIYLATLEEVVVDEMGKERKNSTMVAVYANSVEEANLVAKDYIRVFTNDTFIVGVKKSKFIEILEYLGDVGK